VRNLPSWAADWSVSWPNYRVVEDRGWLGREGRPPVSIGPLYRPMPVFFHNSDENGGVVSLGEMKRILKVYFTRDRHIDGAQGLTVEAVEGLTGGEELFDTYPGVALLLKHVTGKYYTFVTLLPHALFKSGVTVLAGCWSDAVFKQKHSQRHEPCGIW